MSAGACCGQPGGGGFFEKQFIQSFSIAADVCVLPSKALAMVSASIPSSALEIAVLTI